MYIHVEQNTGIVFCNMEVVKKSWWEGSAPYFQIFQPPFATGGASIHSTYLKKPKKRLLGIFPQHCIQIRQCLEQNRHKFYSHDFINKKIPSDLKHHQVHSVVDLSVHWCEDNAAGISCL